MSLSNLGFWSALSLHRLDWSLPFRFSIVLILFRISIFVPNAIWTGALTPIFTKSYSPLVSTLDVPQYGTKSQALWKNLVFTHPMPNVRTSDGVFTYSPNYDLIGLILNQPPSGNISQVHKKLDNTKYSYVGRSYGVGSSVGLMDKDLSHNNNMTLGFNYTEIGFNTTVSCGVDPSSDWHIADIGKGNGGGTYPNIWLVTGTLPNGYGQRYTACNLTTKSDGIFALVGQANKENTNNNFAIAANGYYTSFDKVVCNVTFEPASFLVAVNRMDFLINVTPLQNSSSNATIEFEPTGSIVNYTMRTPTSFSQQHACDLYTSLIGNTFVQNILSTNPNITYNSTASNDDPMVASQVISGTEDTLTSMLDNSLLALSGAQLFVGQDTYPVPASLSIEAVRIGQTSYIALIFAINFAIMLLCLFEFARTRGWKGMSTFDYTNIKAVTIVASKGGVKVAEEASKLRERRWSGAEDDVDVGRIKVRLDTEGEDIKLVGIEGEKGTGKASPRLWRRKIKAGDTELEALRPKSGSP